MGLASCYPLLYCTTGQLLSTTVLHNWPVAIHYYTAQLASCYPLLYCIISQLLSTTVLHNWPVAIHYCTAQLASCYPLLYCTIGQLLLSCTTHSQLCQAVCFINWVLILLLFMYVRLSFNHLMYFILSVMFMMFKTWLLYFWCFVMLLCIFIFRNLWIFVTKLSLYIENWFQYSL